MVRRQMLRRDRSIIAPSARTRDRPRPLRFESLEEKHLLAANLVISEFMASNDGTLIDEDGDSSDWIEIYNAGDATADLNSWKLTDDAEDLGKWSFPAVTLEPNQSLLVFASDKNRAVAGSELHTNFKLSAGGEYLALVEADGSTVAFAYAPEFPSQNEDISYGLAMASSPTVLVDDTTLVRTLVPNDGTLGTSWTQPTFDDSTWDGGPTVTAGVGYEAAPTSVFSYEAFINAPVPIGTTTAYARFEFQLTSVVEINQLSLAMQFDDGFVAYLNGIRVASENAPATPSWNSTATGGTPDEQATDPVLFDLTDHLTELTVGTNVLSFQLLNRSAGSSDLLLIPELTAAQSALIEPLERGYFADPTPGGPNGTAALGFTEPPVFSVSRGFYDSPFGVTLSTGTPGASIYYTTNGSEPNATNGTLYAGPVTVAGTTPLRAVAIKEDFFPSPSVAHTYLFAADIIAQPSQPAGYPDDWGTHNNWTNGDTPFLAVADYEIDADVVGPNDLFGGIYTSRFHDALTALPTLSVTMDIDDAFDGETGFYANSVSSGSAWEREMSVEWWDPSEGGQFQANAGIRAHGGAGRQPWRTPKHAMRLYFRREYGPGRLDFPLFGDGGVARFDRLVLRSHYNDSWQAVSPALHNRAQYVQDPFVRNSFADMGNLSVRSRPVNVYINGLYWGIYDLTERPDGEYFADHLGGESDDYDVITHSGLQDGSRAAWDALLDLVRTTDLSSSAGYEAVKQQLDVQNLVDYMLVNFYAGTDDWPHNNWVTAANRVAGGGFKFYVWDAEISMNQLGANRTEVDATDSPAELYDRLRVNADFRQLFIDRALLHLSDDGALSPTAGTQRYSHLAGLIDEALVAESARWGDVHETIPLTVDDQWQDELDWITDTYLPQRTGIVLSQLQDAGLASHLVAPEFDTAPGQVPTGTMVDLINDEAGATLYYTLDGTDPRDSAGGISASAQIYNGPISITEETTITMRVVLQENWSGLVSGQFRVTALANATNLRVTELHYHPAGPNAAEIAAGFNDADGFEFLELANVSAEPIDLNGVVLGGGVNLSFLNTTLLQPGERSVLVEDLNAFRFRYGVDPSVVGQYGGKLSNGGEDLFLWDAAGEVIQAFTYQDGNSLGWPTTPDGGGPSLVVIDTAGDYNQPDNWRPSGLASGTPAAPELAIPLLDGDYDGNGIVAIEDYYLWRTLFGQTVFVTGIAADGSRNGHIDAADFTVWRDNFGTSLQSLIGSAAQIAVPAMVRSDLPSPSEADLFSFTANAGDQFDVSTRLQTIPNLGIRIFDAKGTARLVYDAPRRSPDHVGRILTESDARLGFSAPADGTYFIQIFGDGGNGVGGYSLSIQAARNSSCLDVPTSGCDVASLAPVAGGTLSDGGDWSQVAWEIKPRPFDDDPWDRSVNGEDIRWGPLGNGDEKGNVNWGAGNVVVGRAGLGLVDSIDYPISPNSFRLHRERATAAVATTPDRSLARAASLADQVYAHFDLHVNEAEFSFLLRDTRHPG